MDVSSFTSRVCISSTSTDAHTHTPVLSHLPVCGRQQGNHNRNPKQRIKDVIQPHTHRNTQNKEPSLPSFNPGRDNLHTCKTHTHTHMHTHTHAHACTHAHTTLLLACNLHLGIGIFHLGMIATGQACIPRLTNSLTQSLSFSTCYSFP